MNDFYSPNQAMLEAAHEAALLAGSVEACGVFMYPDTRFSALWHDRPTVGAFIELENTWEPVAERAARWAWESRDLEAALIAYYGSPIAGAVQLWHSHVQGRPAEASATDLQALTDFRHAMQGAHYWRAADNAQITFWDEAGQPQTNDYREPPAYSNRSVIFTGR